MKRQTTFVVVTVCWILSLAVVFFLGVLAGSSVRPEVGSVAEGTPTTEETFVWGSLVESFPAATEEGTGLTETQRAVRALASIRNPLERRYKTQVVAEMLSQQALAGSIRNMAAELPEPHGREVLLAFLQKWASLDGRSAVAFAAGTELPVDVATAVEAALSGWAQYDAMAAANWLNRAQPTGGFEPQWVRAVVESAAAARPGQALDVVEALDPQWRGHALRVYVEEAAVADNPRRQANRILSLPDSGVRTGALITLMEEWGARNPQEALDWLVQADAGNLEETLVLTLMDQWVLTDPERAARVAARFAPGQRRAEILGRAVAEWLRVGSPADVAEWLNRNEPHEDYDEAIRALVQDAAQENPAAAFTWALAIRNPNEQEMAALAAGQEWLQEEPQRAASYIARAPISERLRETLIGPPQEEFAPAASQQQAVAAADREQGPVAPRATVSSSPVTGLTPEEAVMDEDLQAEYPGEEFPEDEYYEEDLYPEEYVEEGYPEEQGL